MRKISRGRKILEVCVFYSDYISYIDAIKKAAFGTEIKYSIEEKNRFLESNTWSVRAKIVSKMIDKKMKK